MPSTRSIAGEAIDLGTIVQPLYAISAEEDHIAPWRSALLGIVNPVITPPKRQYWVGEPGRDETPDAWRKRAENHKGSWWEDWSAWLKPRSGPMVAAGPVDSAQYTAIADAPGTYVLER